MRDARVSFDWADGTYTFRLAWGELGELQEKCDAGPYLVLQRLHSGAWRIEDITNIIRLGLIGGGMEPAPALKLARRYVEDRPPMENLVPAQVILSAALTGTPEERVGEDDAASQTENSSTNSLTES
ncbi:gene transfer agent family protein [Agrobacterium tumefaciens]|uniref:gene transfer agent family protein n=1 Tax=Agrobacterium tumefaciens TaxID=358 RepID=UPI0021FECB1C|nr:gene transfer agent family protein [Agrobacterium tumefaciens]